MRSRSLVEVLFRSVAAVRVAALFLLASSAWAAVTLTPASATLSPGATQTFTASEPVTWSLDAGDLSYDNTTATYSATSSGANLSPGTYTLTATSQADPTQTASATITVTAGAPPAALSVSPASATLQPGAQASFTANAPVTWSVTAGSLSYNATMAQFTAAASGANLPPGTYTLTATGQADTTQVVQIPITVTGSASSPVTLTPTAATVQPGASQAFTANQPVTWSVTAGSLSYSDTSATFTASASGSNLPAGTYTLTATSKADATQSASATITVPTSASSPVTLTPSTATVQPGASQAFTANQPVTWSVTAGSLSYSDTSATFTASASGSNLPAGTYTLTATSKVDATQSASATITVPASASSPVTLTPTTATVQPGASQAFTANQPVAWSVTAGSLSYSDTSATFTASASGSNLPAGTYTLTATSKADATQSATATVTVPAPPPPATLTLTPMSATIPNGGSQAFTANQAVTWAFSAGSITYSDTSLTYSASASGQALPSGSYTVTATAKVDPSKTVTAIITVLPPLPPPIQVSPSASSLPAGASQAFTSSAAATWTCSAGAFTATGDTSATWSASDASGHALASGSYTVTATLKSDPTKTATAAVTVTDPNAVVAVALNPTVATLTAGGSQAFTATVTNASNSAVTWTMSAGGLSYTDTTATYTAAASGQNLPPGDYTLTATSQADTTKSAIVTIHVVASKVALSPASVSLHPGAIQAFTPTVVGLPSGSVSWKVLENGGGTVDASGVYSAPATPGLYHVQATSQSDTTQFAVAAVTVLDPNAVVAVQIAPQEITLDTGANTAFSASVTGSSNTAVTWEMSKGSITYTDTTATYTAPDQPGTYTLTARSQADPTKTATAQIHIRYPGAPTITACSVDKTEIQQGDTVTLTWAATGATSFTVRGGGSPTPLGSDQTSLVLHPTDTDSVYDLIASNDKGDDTRTVHIHVIKPTIVSFTTDAAMVGPGASAHLTAVFANGTGSISPVVGSVTSGTPVAVAPSTLTVYTLTVTNALGTSTQAIVKVEVSAAGQWIPTTGTMAQKRFNQDMASLNDGRILLAYGDTVPGDFIHYGNRVPDIVPGQNQGFELYDPRTDSFQTLPATTAGVDHVSGATATLMPDGRVLMVGGVSAFPSSNGTAAHWSENSWIQYLNPGTGQLQNLPPISQGDLMGALPRFGHVATLLLNGQVLLLGGRASLICPAARENGVLVDPYATSQGNPATNLTVVGPVQSGMLGMVLLPDGDVLGYGLGSQIYHAQDGTFTPFQGKLSTNQYWDPTVPSWMLGAVLLHSGKVLILGQDAWGIWDPAQTTPYQLSGPVDLTGLDPSQARLLPNGKVLIPAMGKGGTSLVFDPALNGFEALSSGLAADRGFGAAASSWLDGRVLTAGGVTLGSSGNYAGINTAERLDAQLPFTLSPAFQLVKVGATLQFSATQNGAALPVSWTASAGAVTTSGLWTAPQTPGIYTVTAMDGAGHALMAQVTVVNPQTGVPGSIAISPRAVQLNPGDHFGFQVKFTSGIADQRLGWKVVETGSASVDANGVFTAPPSPGTYHVAVYSVADPSFQSNATVTVSQGASTGMTITPTSAHLAPGQTQAFSATTSGGGAPSGAVSWSTVESGGTLTDNGDGTAAYAAGSPGTYHVVALSKLGPPTTIQAVVTVVMPQAPQIVSFAASANPIAKGQSTTLSWSVTGADSLTLAGTDGLSQTVQATGSLVVSPTMNQTYTLTANNAGGGNSATVVLAVTQPLVWKGDRIFAFGKLISEDKAQADGSVQTTYVQSDQVGSPDFVSDASGALVGKSKNLPFGERFSETGFSATNHPFIRFAGHEGDANTWTYMQAREYLPAYGRFAEPDPAHDQGFENPQSWDLYGYVTNNPVTGIDPTGMRVDWLEKVKNWVKDGYAETNAQRDERHHAMAEQEAYSQAITKQLNESNEFFKRNHIPIPNPYESSSSNSDRPHSSLHTGLQADGSYLADLAKLDQMVRDRKLVGSGECYALGQLTAGLPNHRLIERGAAVSGNIDLPEGTVIGIFSPDGSYASKHGKAHIVIFRHHLDNDRFAGTDQWNRHGDSPAQVPTTRSVGHEDQYFVVHRKDE